MSDSSIAYLDGAFLPLSQARVSPLDRGFLFADGVYEVIPVYSGRLFRLTEHLQRLQRSLDGIRLENPHSLNEWAAILEDLVGRNGSHDQNVYLQITRGAAAGRTHDFPVGVRPTEFAMSSPMAAVDPQALEQGVDVILVDDDRWQHCNLKTVALLANVLLKQRAADAGAAEALLVREGRVVEGSSSNVFVVVDGLLLTPPKSQYLLGGVTRDLLLELAQANEIPFAERDIPVGQLRQADEVWISSSTREVSAVRRVDGQPVGSGRPGPMWRRMLSLYQDYKADLVRATA